MMAIYKNKGSKSDCANYQVISLLSAESKFLARILLNTLHVISEKNLPKSQCGCRLEYSAVDMLFAVRQVRKKYRVQSLNLYAVVIDLTKAFNTVNRETIFIVL
jgi:hypothetical protein